MRCNSLLLVLSFQLGPFLDAKNTELHVSKDKLESLCTVVRVVIALVLNVYFKLCVETLVFYTMAILKICIYIVVHN